MSKARKRYNRRKRRQAKASIRNPAGKPRHKLQAGRTGSVHAKRLRSRRKEK